MHLLEGKKTYKTGHAGVFEGTEGNSYLQKLCLLACPAYSSQACV